MYSENYPDIAYNEFLNIFFKAYDSAFPRNPEKSLKKTLLSPWVTKGIQKPLKKEQKLYEKLLKKRTCDYKNIFDRIKSSSTKQCYKNRLMKYENNLKGTWSIIIGVLEKRK